MFGFCAPLQLVLIEDAKYDVLKQGKEIQDKQIQAGLGYRRASDWSKVKKGERPLPLQRLLDVDAEQRPFVIALLRRCAAALEAEALPAKPEFEERDLLEDFIVKAQAILDRKRTAKAGIRSAVIAEKVSA